MIIVIVISLIMLVIGIFLLWIGWDTLNDSFLMIGIFLSIVFGIISITCISSLIYVSTAPYRPSYREMLKRVEASGEYDQELNKEIYEWNTLCDWYNHEEYMIEYKNVERKGD